MSLIIDREMNDITPLPEAVKTVVQGPGIALRQARIALNLSEEDIAKQLRLSSKVVNALENDDYSHMACIAFARGYLRSYARVVGLSGDEIAAKLELLGHTESESPANILPQPAYLQASNKKVEKIIRLATYLIIAILLALVFMWWKNSRPNKPVVVQTEQTEQTEQLAQTEQAEILLPVGNSGLILDEVLAAGLIGTSFVNEET